MFLLKPSKFLITYVDIFFFSKGYPLTPGKMPMGSNTMAPPKTPNTPSNGMLTKSIQLRFTVTNLNIVSKVHPDTGGSL